jgi:hypothetical protein
MTEQQTKNTLALVCALLLFFSLTAAVPDIQPHKTDTPPEIDGILDDDIWQNAPSVTGFRTWNPDYDKPMGYQTTVKMAYDAENLYFAFECQDEPDLIKTSFAQRDKIRDDDWICINLDSYNDRQSLYALYVNPSGIQMDTRYSNGQEDAGADFIWYSQSTIHEQGYDVEVRIPFKSIRYSVRDGKVQMGVIFERKISRTSIQGTYPPLDPDMGTAFLMQSMLLEYEDIKPNMLLELLPAFTYGEGTQRVEGDNQKTGGIAEFGLTGKWGISSDLVLDATVNPDFSQVEADARQIDNNVRFNLFFPERRPFFLEGIENFIVAGTGSGESLQQVVNTRSIVNPDVALKFSGKIGDKNRIASIFALDDQLSPTGEDLPNANVYVGRFIRVLKGDSFLGGIYTQRDTEERSNSVGGVDGTIRLGQASTISGHFINSFTTNRITQQTDHNHTEKLNYLLNNRRITVSAAFLNISEGFNTDVGFVNRTGLTGMSLFVNPKIYPKSDLLIRIDNQFQVGQGYDHPSGLWEKNIGYTLRTNWIRRTTLSLGFNISDEIFRGMRFSRNRYRVSLGSQVDKRLQISSSFSKSKKIRYIFDEALQPYEGRGVDVNGSVTWQASDQFNFNMTLRYSNFFRDSDDFKEFDRTIIRSRNIFQLNKYFLFRSILEYDTNRKELFTDFLASFQLIPGTVVHLGYGSLYDRQEWDPNSREYAEANRFFRDRNNFFFKASYLWRL